MALTGNMIATASGGNPSIVNYVIFVSVFGMLSLFYLIVATIKEDFSIAPIFMVVADALNVLFFLVGGIALAAYLGVHSCNNHVCSFPHSKSTQCGSAERHSCFADRFFKGYVTSNLVTAGSNGDPGKRCREAQAVTAFLWFGFAAFAGSLVFSFMGMRSGLTPATGGLRRGKPSTSYISVKATAKQVHDFRIMCFHREVVEDLG